MRTPRAAAVFKAECPGYPDRSGSLDGLYVEAALENDGTANPRIGCTSNGDQNHPGDTDCFVMYPALEPNACAQKPAATSRVRMSRASVSIVRHRIVHDQATDPLAAAFKLCRENTCRAVRLVRAAIQSFQEI